MIMALYRNCQCISQLNRNKTEIKQSQILEICADSVLFFLSLCANSVLSFL